jgi:hypothetical protein
MVLEQVSPPRVHFRFHRARSSKRNPPNFKIPEIPRPIDGNMPEKLFFLEVCTAGGLSAWDYSCLNLMCVLSRFYLTQYRSEIFTGRPLCPAKIRAF